MVEPIGKIDNLPIKSYHQMPGYSKTALDQVNRSIAHYLEYLKTHKESTPSQLFGAALHCRVLTPDLYVKEYVVAPECDRRTKAGKELWENFQVDNFDKTVITSDIAARVELCAESVLSHPTARWFLSKGEAEQSFFWKQKIAASDYQGNVYNGELLCKTRPDYWRRDGIVVEVKTTADASYDSFQRTITNYRYHMQGSMAIDGITACGESANTFVIVAVESEAPFCVAVYKLDDAAIQVGKGNFCEDLGKILKYEADQKKWAGYPVDVQDMYLPSWAA